MFRFLTGLLALAALALLSERQWRGQVRTVPACGPRDTCTIGRMWQAQGNRDKTLVVEFRCEVPGTWGLVKR